MAGCPHKHTKHTYIHSYTHTHTHTHARIEMCAHKCSLEKKSLFSEDRLTLRLRAKPHATVERTQILGTRFWPSQAFTPHKCPHLVETHFVRDINSNHYHHLLLCSHKRRFEKRALPNWRLHNCWLEMLDYNKNASITSIKRWLGFQSMSVFCCDVMTSSVHQTKYDRACERTQKMKRQRVKNVNKPEHAVCLHLFARSINCHKRAYKWLTHPGDSINPSPFKVRAKFTVRGRLSHLSTMQHQATIREMNLLPPITCLNI